MVWDNIFDISTDRFAWSYSLIWMIHSTKYHSLTLADARTRMVCGRGLVAIAVPNGTQTEKFLRKSNFSEISKVQNRTLLHDHIWWHWVNGYFHLLHLTPLPVSPYHRFGLSYTERTPIHRRSLICFWAYLQSGHQWCCISTSMILFAVNVCGDFE